VSMQIKVDLLSRW